MKIIVAICLLAVMKVEAWPLKFQAQFEELTFDSKKDPMFWEPMDEGTTALPTMQNYDETSFSDMTTAEMEEFTTGDMTSQAAEELTTEGMDEATTGDTSTVVRAILVTEEVTSPPEDLTTAEMATERTESMEEFTTGESRFYKDYWYGETTATHLNDDANFFEMVQ